MKIEITNMFSQQHGRLGHKKSSVSIPTGDEPMTFWSQVQKLYYWTTEDILKVGPTKTFAWLLSTDKRNANCSFLLLKGNFSDHFKHNH